MWGPTGLLRFASGGIVISQDTGMIGHLRHLSPDDEGSRAESSAALSYGQLTNLDLSAPSEQPLRSDKGRNFLARSATRMPV